MKRENHALGMRDISKLLPTPTRADGEGGGRAQHTERADKGGSGGLREAVRAFATPAGERYRCAVERWQEVSGVKAPWPNDEKGRLSPEFAEWMMGFPVGHTDIPGVSRSARLRCIGNAVAPPAVALAWSLLTGEQPC